jgi:hypothetical protein
MAMPRELTSMKTVFPKGLRLAAALLFTVLPQLSNAADWKAIAKKDTFTASVDVSSIRPQDHLVSANILMSYTTDQTSEGTQKPYRSIVLVWAFNCKLGHTTTIRMDTFTATGERASKAIFENANDRWVEVPPDGPQREILRFVCEHPAARSK